MFVCISQDYMATVGGGGGGLSNLPVLPTEPIPQTQLQPQIQVVRKTIKHGNFCRFISPLETWSSSKAMDW